VFAIKNKLPELILEAAFVVFAVLLALGVDEWRENRTNQKLADRTRDNIIEEIHANYFESISTRSLHDSLLVQYNGPVNSDQNELLSKVNLLTANREVTSETEKDVRRQFQGEGSAGRNQGRENDFRTCQPV